MRRFIFFTLIFSFFLGGCQTVKNTGLGIGSGTVSTLYGFGKGLADDIYNTYQAIEKADKWFREHYW